MSDKSDIALVFSPNSRRPSETVLAERYSILPDSPVTEFDSPGTKAYVVNDLQYEPRNMFARVLAPDVTPRIETMIKVRSMTELDLMRPVHWGAVYWPPEGQRRFVVVFERPDRSVLMPSLSAQITPLHFDIVNRTLLDPIVMTLTELARRGATYRAIRPDNIYPGAQEDSPVLLGDNVSTPPAWAQSAILETVEIGMTPPLGRGDGTLADDMYALGATILFLALGFCPVVDMSDDDIIAAKMQQGSFSALLGGERPPFGMRDPLRGLLCDDPEERWTPDDVQQYLGGAQHRTVGQQSDDTENDRPFYFEGAKYRQFRDLAQSFGKEWKAAAAVVTDERFEKWFHRGIAETNFGGEDDKILSKLAASTIKGENARAVAQICSILQPQGPLRYKGITLFPDGVGSILAHAHQAGQKKTISIIGEAVTDNVFSDWVEFHERYLGQDWAASSKNVKRLEQLMKQDGPGFGVERCLYEFNLSVPCLSKFLDGAYVYVLDDLLPALEAYLAEKSAFPTIIDRHVTAFIAARDKSKIDQSMVVLEKGDDSVDAKLCFLNMLSNVQSGFGPKRVPHLTQLFAEELESILDRFHSRSLRQARRESYDEVIAAGNLTRLYKLLSDPKAVKRDQMQRKTAEREYAIAEAKIKELQSERFGAIARQSGWSIAAGISTFVASCTVAILVVW